MATDDCINNCVLSLITFNMHGFNQGWPAISELIDKFSPGIFVLQEHWLTPANLGKFNDFFDGYFNFGSSAMSHIVESDIFYGRPYGGTMFMINNNLRSFVETVHSSERYAVIRVFNYLIFNVYFPCSGSLNKNLICDELICEIDSWCDQFNTCEMIIAGDFNSNLNGTDYVSNCVRDLFVRRNVVCCDSIFPDNVQATYVNDSLGHYSLIDHVATSVPHAVLNYIAPEVSSNFSDHTPIMAVFNITVNNQTHNVVSSKHCSINNVCNVL